MLGVVNGELHVAQLLLAEAKPSFVAVEIFARAACCMVHLIGIMASEAATTAISVEPAQRSRTTSRDLAST